MSELHSFSWVNNIPSCRLTTLFVHSLAIGHFWVVSTFDHCKYAAMNRFCADMCTVPWICTYKAIGWVMWKLYTLSQNCQIVFHSGCHVLHSHEPWKMPLLHICRTLVMIHLWGWARQCPCGWESFPWMTDVIIFHIVVAILHVIFGEMCIQVFVLCLVGSFVFLLLSYKSSLF